MRAGRRLGRGPKFRAGRVVRQRTTPLSAGFDVVSVKTEDVAVRQNNPSDRPARRAPALARLASPSAPALT